MLSPIRNNVSFGRFVNDIPKGQIPELEEAIDLALSQTQPVIDHLDRNGFDVHLRRNKATLHRSGDYGFDAYLVSKDGETRVGASFGYEHDDLRHLAGHILYAAQFVTDRVPALGEIIMACKERMKGSEIKNI